MSSSKLILLICVGTLNRTNIEIFNSSGVYGVEGKMLMIATGYTVAGVLIVVIFSLDGCCIFGKGAGAYDDLVDDEITNGIHPPVQKNYSKVANVNDA